MVICLERGADLHLAQLMPLPLTVSCFSKIHIGFTFLVPAHPDSPGKRPLNRCVYNTGQTAFSRHLQSLASTPPGMPGTHLPNILVGGTSTGISPQYYYILSDIADQYWLPSVRSASSRFHSAIRRHQFASVRQADSRLARLVPPNLELALTPLPAVKNWCKVLLPTCPC